MATQKWSNLSFLKSKIANNFKTTCDLYFIDRKKTDKFVFSLLKAVFITISLSQSAKWLCTMCQRQMLKELTKAGLWIKTTWRTENEFKGKVLYEQLFKALLWSNLNDRNGLNLT